MYIAACNGLAHAGEYHGSMVVAAMSSTDKHMNSYGLFTYNKKLKNGGKKVKSAFGPSGQSGRSLSRFL